MFTCWLGVLTCALAGQDPSWIDRLLDGSRALERGEHEAAREVLEEGLRLLPEHAATAWQLAGACALAGDTDAAFEWLERAVDWGGGEATLLEWDPDLASVRADERFAELRERLVSIDRAREHRAIDAVVAKRGWNSFLDASPHGDVVAARNPAGLFLYDLRAHETLGVIGSPGDQLGTAELSDDGRWLVATFRSERSGSGNGTMRVCDARTGDRVREVADVPWHGDIQFSRDGERMVATAPFEPGGVWETRGWTRILDCPAGTEHGILSPDGARLVLLARSSANVRVAELSFWDVDRAEIVASHEDLDAIDRGSLSYSIDGALVVALAHEGHRAAYIFDGRTGERLRAIDPVEAAFTEACFLGDSGELVTLEESGLVRIWSARYGREMRRFRIESDSWLALAASPDGRLLLASRSYGQHEMLDASNGAVLWSCAFELDGITSMWFTSDGSRVVAESANDELTLRDARTGAVLLSMPETNLGTATCAHPSRDEFFVSASDGSLRRIDARTGRALGSRHVGGFADTGLHVSPDGSLLAARDRQRTLRLIDADRGALRAAIPEAWQEGHFSHVRQFAFAPDGSSCAVTGYHTSVHVYATEDGSLRGVLDPGEDRGELAYRPDGKRIAVAAARGRIFFFDSETGVPLEPELAIDGEVETLAFEPSGARLWVGSDRSKVHVFDVESGALVRSLDLSDLDAFDTVELGSIAFDPDGALAVTTSSGYGVVAAWRVETGERVWDYHYSGGNPSALQCAFGASRERVYVWGQGGWSPRVVDAANGQTLCDLGTGGRSALHPMPHEDLLGAEERDGLEILDARTGERRWARIETRDGGWLLHSAGLWVDGTRQALEEIQLLLEDRSYPLDALAAALLDPKRVRAAAEGIVLAPAGLPLIPTLEWSDVPPRVVQLRAEDPPRSVTLEASCPEGIAGFELVRGGVRSRLAGEGIDLTRRRLVLTVEPPAGKAPVHLRVRAIGARGVLSRALHLTLERAR